MNDLSERSSLNNDEPAVDEIALESDVSGDHSSVKLNSVLPELPPAEALFERLEPTRRGNLYSGRDRALGRIVNIRLLGNLSVDPEETNALIREARITAQLEHPAIAPVYSLSLDAGGNVCLAEKRIYGKSLREYIRKLISVFSVLPHSRRIAAGKRHLRRRIELFIRIADALKFAHSRNIAHGALSSAGILLDSRGSVYIRNWRNAVYDESVSARCFQEDIHALGCILKDLVFLLERTSEQNGGLPEKDSVGVRIDSVLRAIIKRAMTKEQGAGYHNVPELKDDLRRWLAGEETLALPDNPVKHYARSFSRRRKIIFFSCAGAAAVFCTAALFYLNTALNDKRGELRRDHALLTIHANGFAVGVEFDRRIRTFAESAYGLQKQVEALLKAPPQASALKHRFYNNMDGIKDSTAPKGYLFSPTYRQRIDFEHFVYKLSPDSPVPDLETVLARLEPVIPTFRQIIFSGMGNSYFDTLPLAEKLNYAGTKEKPMVGFVYLSFNNGLHICYPYHADYALDYDPRKRGWYRETEESPGAQVHWTTPYIDNGDIRELVITCAKKMYDGDGNFIGCLGMDITLTRTISELMRSGNSAAFVSAKLLVDHSGQVLADTSGKYACRQKGNSVIFPEFADSDLLKQMWSSDHGQLIKETPDGRKMYFFIRIKSLDWIYVEEIDYDGLMKND